MPTAMAPRLTAAHQVTIHSGQFAARMPTRSPGPTPNRSRNALATEATARRWSENEMRRSPCTMYSRSPKPAEPSKSARRDSTRSRKTAMRSPRTSPTTVSKGAPGPVSWDSIRAWRGNSIARSTVTSLRPASSRAGTVSRNEVPHLAQRAHRVFRESGRGAAESMAAEDHLCRSLHNFDHIGGASQAATRHKQAVVHKEDSPALPYRLADSVGKRTRSGHDERYARNLAKEGSLRRDRKEGKAGIRKNRRVRRVCMNHGTCIVARLVHRTVHESFARRREPACAKRLTLEVNANQDLRPQVAFEELAGCDPELIGSGDTNAYIATGRRNELLRIELAYDRDKLLALLVRGAYGLLRRRDGRAANRSKVTRIANRLTRCTVQPAEVRLEVLQRHGLCGVSGERQFAAHGLFHRVHPARKHPVEDVGLEAQLHFWPAVRCSEPGRHSAAAQTEEKFAAKIADQEVERHVLVRGEGTQPSILPNLFAEGLQDARELFDGLTGRGSRCRACYGGTRTRDRVALQIRHGRASSRRKRSECPRRREAPRAIQGEFAERIWVKDVLRALAVHDPREVSCDDAALVGSHLQRVPANMRRCNHIRQGEERMVCARWFDRKRIEGGTREMACPELLGEGRLVHQGGPCSVHEESTALHPREFAGTEQTAAVVTDGGVEAHEIARGQQIVQRNCFRSCSDHLIGRQVGVIHQYPCPERAKALCDLTAHGAKSHEPHGLSPELPPAEGLKGLAHAAKIARLDFRIPQEPFRCPEFPREHQEERER